MSALTTEPKEDRVKLSFLNHVRSLFNIDGYLLPELTQEQQAQFLRDPVRYFIGTDKAQSDAIWREIVARQGKDGVTLQFIDKSARAAIKALRELEQTAIGLETYAPEIFPEINEQGQKHFGRVLMEASAESIRDAWAQAIAEVQS